LYLGRLQLSSAGNAFEQLQMLLHKLKITRKCWSVSSTCVQLTL